MGIKSYGGFLSLSQVSLWSLWETRLLGEVSDPSAQSWAVQCSVVLVCVHVHVDGMHAEARSHPWTSFFRSPSIFLIQGF